MEIHPYLHLPLKRTQLVQYFQAASLVSLHNVYPLLFFVPFWARYVAGGPWGSATAWAWLTSLFVCLLLSHYLNTLIRIALDRYGKVLLIVTTGGYFIVLDLRQNICFFAFDYVFEFS